MNAPGNAAPAPRKYEPNRTLGRSGYQRDPETQLHARMEQLDALLTLISNADVTGEDHNDFQRMNGSIQRAILGLASELAQEAHELYTRVHVYGDGGAQ